jgi:hypothetical protein
MSRCLNNNRHNSLLVFENSTAGYSKVKVGLESLFANNKAAILSPTTFSSDLISYIQLVRTPPTTRASRRIAPECSKSYSSEAHPSPTVAVQ